MVGVGDTQPPLPHTTHTSLSGVRSDETPVGVRWVQSTVDGVVLQVPLVHPPIVIVGIVSFYRVRYVCFLVRSFFRFFSFFHVVHLLYQGHKDNDLELSIAHFHMTQ